MEARADRLATRGGGWRTFAGVMIMLAGIFNFIDGIVAVMGSNYYSFYYTSSGNSSVTLHHLVFGSSVAAWGWMILILGVVEFLAALAIFARMPWAAAVGIFVAALNAIGQLLWIGVYPWWSVIAIAIDVLVIYGLAMYGFEPAS